MTKTVLTGEPSATNLNAKRAKRTTHGREVVTNKKMLQNISSLLSPNNHITMLGLTHKFHFAESDCEFLFHSKNKTNAP